MTRRRSRRGGRAWSPGSIVTEIAVARCIKAAVERPRPGRRRSSDADGFAYPSGHAALAVTYLAIAVAARARGARCRAASRSCSPALALAVLIGLSRVYLRVHYLSDVVGGWAVGLAAFSTVRMPSRCSWFTYLRPAASAARPRPSRVAPRRAEPRTVDSLTVTYI